jgi:hypothetical protein
VLGELHASIRAYVGRELRMVPLVPGYELRDHDTVLARLSDTAFARVVDCVTRDGSWQFERRRGAEIEVTQGGAAVARYQSNVLGGGAIELPDGLRLRLRPPVIGQTWRVRRGLREIILLFGTRDDVRELEIAPGAQDIYHLPLLTMLAFYAMLVEIDTPSGGGGGAGASS